MDMDREMVLQEFRSAEALLEGHFILSSGMHSAVYLQCARVLMNPDRSERLCKALVGRIPSDIINKIDLVVSPAMGGVIVGYEMARQIKVDSFFVERVDGKFALRRGFSIPDGAAVFMMEDVVTTGLSSRECIETIKQLGGNVIAAGCLIDRSGGTANVGVPLYALASINAEAYDPLNLPEDLSKIPAVKPGSRALKS